MSRLLSSDVDMVVDPADSDVVVVNTCGFLGASREESLAAIRRAVELKSHGVKGVVVTGCMVGNYAPLINAQAPGVDRLVDFADYRKISEYVDAIMPPAPGPRLPFTKPGKYVQARLTPAHFAYLKISEGCDHTCTFCVIPQIRGPMRSVPIEELLGRARRLVDMGAKELNLVAQDSTLYGVDIYGKRRLADLMRALAEIDGLRWIRLLYAYPTEVDENLLQVMAEGGKVLPYIDVPLQHSSDRMLKLMSRRSTTKDLEDLMDRLRARIPRLVVRTTFIVGFPGETEDDFKHLLDFTARRAFERMGAFAYSPEEGSPAFAMGEQVADAVKAERVDTIMKLQKSISGRYGQARLGAEIDVLVDDPGADDRSGRGRSAADAPEIDGTVHFTGAAPRAGGIARVRVERADDYDLFGTVVSS